MKAISTFMANLARIKWYIWIFFAIFFAFAILALIKCYCEPMLFFAAGYSLLINFFIFYTYARYNETSSAVPDDLSLKIKQKEAPLKISEILLKEYDYVRETASQAMNDRHTVVNYFLLITGGVITLVGAILQSIKFTIDERDLSLQVILLAFNFIGWIYFLKIIRLRQAWMESARSMNHIKKFYVQNSGIARKDCDKVFRWKFQSLPSAHKRSNVFYYSAVLISFFTSIALLIAWIIASQASLRFHEYRWIAYLIGIYHYIFQILMYTEFLREPPDKKN